MKYELDTLQRDALFEAVDAYLHSSENKDTLTRAPHRKGRVLELREILKRADTVTVETP